MRRGEKSGLWIKIHFCCREHPSSANFNTTPISDILNRLVDKSTYDKRLRPKYGAEPVDVGITIHVSSISAVSEVDMVCSYLWN